MKTKLMALTLLAAGSMFAQTRFSAGISFGGPVQGFSQPAPVYAANVPPAPGPGYTWVDGYWSQNGGRNVWVAGSWTRQAFGNGYAAAPSYEHARLDDRFQGGDRQSSDRSFDQDRDRGSDHDRDDHDRGDHDRNSGRGRESGRGDEFRGR